MAKIKVFPDIYRFSRAAAEFFVTTAKNIIWEGGVFSVALCGGGTPESIYALLSTEAYSSRVDWDKVHVFWGDERLVSPNHIESNYRMARYSLIQPIPLPPENIHRIQGELAPQDAVRHYDAELRAFFGEEALFPRFDLVLLGMGTDGHTASLFPYTEALQEEKAWVVANEIESLNSWRITLTAPAINAAANIVFLATGEAKASRIRDVIEGEYDPQRLPAQLIRPTEGNLIWLLDEEAASLLAHKD